MELSYSCNLFEKFSNAVHWIVENKLGIQGCAHVLDDFFFHFTSSYRYMYQVIRSYSFFLFLQKN
jgi:hypothetical protein